MLQIIIFFIHKCNIVLTINLASNPCPKGLNMLVKLSEIILLIGTDAGNGLIISPFSEAALDYS